MAEPGITPDPNPQGGASDGGNKVKLYAGKFKTIEEMEAAHKELESKWHEERQANSQIRQEVGEIKELLQTTYGQGGTREQYTPATGDPNANTKVLQELYQNPIGVLAAHGESVKRELKAELARDQAIQNRNAAVVQKWTQDNPDVAAYPDLLSFYVQQTDARFTPDKRLDEAARIVRARVLELKQGRTPSGPGPGDHIEGPSGGFAPGGVAPSGNQPTAPADPERELAQYVASRNARARKPLGSRGQAA